MVILKHAKYKIKDKAELDSLMGVFYETTSRVEGVRLQEIYFPKYGEGFVLKLHCESEEVYQEWKRMCPPPAPGAKDRYEVYLTAEEKFPE